MRVNLQNLYRIEREAKENAITGEGLVALRRRSMRAGVLDDGASDPLPGSRPFSDGRASRGSLKIRRTPLGPG
jgi:hypothetical protein